METKEYKKLYKVWERINSELYDECEKFLMSQLVVLPNKRIELGSSYNDVKSVYIKDGKIRVDTEDMVGYNISDFNAEELYHISLAVEEIIKDEFYIE